MLYDIEIEGTGRESWEGADDTDRYCHFTVEAHAPRRERNGAMTIPNALGLYALLRAQGDSVDAGTLTVSGFQPPKIGTDGNITGSMTWTLETFHWSTHVDLVAMIDAWSRKPRNGRTVFYRPTERY